MTLNHHRITLNEARGVANANTTAARKIPFTNRKREQMWLRDAIEKRDECFEELCKSGLNPKATTLADYWMALGMIEVQTELLLTHEGGDYE